LATRRGPRAALALVSALVLMVLAPRISQSQVSRDDYARAERFLGANAGELVSDDAVTPRWIGPDRFWYRNRTPRGYEFVVVDAITGARQPAFDHPRLAAALSLAADTSFDGNKFPFRDIRFVEGGAVRFSVGAKKTWT